MIVNRTPLSLSALALVVACSSAAPSLDSSPEPDASTPPPAATGADAGNTSVATGTGMTTPVDAGVDAPAAPFDSGILGTGGKGGLACSRKDALGGGRTSCVASVGGVELKIVVAAPSAGAGAVPYRLGLYLHGDGAEYHKNNQVLTAMLPWADAHHGVFVSALAPNGCAWWQAPSYDCVGPQSAFDTQAGSSAALATALDAIMKAYDIRTDGIRYYSASGGSMFVTDQWIPLQGAKYPGVFALHCGGLVPSRAYAWDANDAGLRARNKLWFTYGSADGLVPEIESSIASYTNKGFAVTPKVIADAGHCTFDVDGEALAIWSANP